VNNDEAVVAVVKALEAIGVPFMVTGSFASNFYGVPRATKDADFILETDAIDFARLRSALGPELQLDPQLSFEGVTTTFRYQIHKRSSPPFTIELFILSNDPYDLERFRRRRRGTTVGVPVELPSPEDVIINKLRWSKQGRRTKDIDDARNVIAVQTGRLDWDYIHRWCDVHGTRELLENIRRSIPTKIEPG